MKLTFYTLYNIDSINNVIERNNRYLMVWRILGYELYTRSHSVMKVHLNIGSIYLKNIIITIFKVLVE